MQINLTPSQIERFWSRVDKTGECWIHSATPSSVYPIVHFNGHGHYASRISWVIAHGQIADGLEVCHNCPGGDNPRCCNPAHLFLGTRKENQADMAAKGRAATGDRHSSRTHPERVARGERSATRLHPESICRGEQSPNSKITADDVREIRARYAAGGVFYHELGTEFGVSASQIFHIVRRKAWRHVS
jgi:hypothetical protein